MASRRTTSRQAAYSLRADAQELAPRRHLARTAARPGRACRAAARPAPRRPRSPWSTTRRQPSAPRAGGFRASAARRWRSRAAPRRESQASRPLRWPRRAASRWRGAPAPARSPSALMPQPSSVTSIRSSPPCAKPTAIRVAPASIAFSTSSLSAEAGRSTTSPAAMRLTSVFGQAADCRHGRSALAAKRAAIRAEPCKSPAAFDTNFWPLRRSFGLRHRRPLSCRRSPPACRLARQRRGKITEILDGFVLVASSSSSARRTWRSTSARPTRWST